MDFERIYKKLDCIDHKLDKHMLNMEGRVTRLEERSHTISGQIKIILGIIISAFSALITWIGKHLFNF